MKSYYMLYNVFLILVCYINYMEIAKIYLKNKEYCLDKEKLLCFINMFQKIKSNEKSIFKILKNRKLLDEIFLNNFKIF